MDWDLNNDISYSHTFTLKAHSGNKCKFQTKDFLLLFLVGYGGGKQKFEISEN